jgi:hypothetical protein
MRQFSILLTISYLVFKVAPEQAETTFLLMEPMITHGLFGSCNL